MEWEALDALRKTEWVIAGFCRGKVSAVDVSFSFTFPHPFYFRITSPQVTYVSLGFLCNAEFALCLSLVNGWQ